MLANFLVKMAHLVKKKKKRACSWRSELCEARISLFYPLQDIVFTNGKSQSLSSPANGKQQTVLSHGDPHK